MGATGHNLRRRRASARALCSRGQTLVERGDLEGARAVYQEAYRVHRGVPEVPDLLEAIEAAESATEPQDEPPVEESPSLADKNVPELREIASALGIKNYTSLRKDDLIVAIQEGQEGDSE